MASTGVAGLTEEGLGRNAVLVADFLIKQSRGKA